jgi:hypothetical protein
MAVPLQVEPFHVIPSAQRRQIMPVALSVTSRPSADTTKGWAVAAQGIKPNRQVKKRTASCDVFILVTSYLSDIKTILLL